MTRRTDWLDRMQEVLQAARAEPFAFGQHDCVHLVAAVLDAMTGSRWRAELAGIYKSGGGAKRIMAQPGRLDELVSGALGSPVPVNLARRGDVVGLIQENGPAIGICVGDKIAVAGDGVVYLPMTRAHCAWRVE